MPGFGLELEDDASVTGQVLVGQTAELVERPAVLCGAHLAEPREGHQAAFVIPRAAAIVQRAAASAVQAAVLGGLPEVLQVTGGGVWAGRASHREARPGWSGAIAARGDCRGGGRPAVCQWRFS